jgi:hypothetical protein
MFSIFVQKIFENIHTFVHLQDHPTILFP